MLYNQNYALRTFNFITFYFQLSTFYFFILSISPQSVAKMS